MDAHDTPLIATIVMGLGLAFVFGTLAHRLRLPAIVGYIVAGVLIGPHTPGFVADQSLASELAELGVVLLMFGVGLHFSPKEMFAVRGVAVPGAILLAAISTLMGAGFAWSLGWPLGGQIVMGLALSSASTVVVLRALEERGALETPAGRVTTGWLIAEDLAVVFVLVLLPVFARVLGAKGPSDPLVDPFGVGFWAELGLAAVKLAAFMAAMLIAGRRLIPRILGFVERRGSPELFRLGVLAIALGVAFGSARLFDVSMALGAFFAGMILSETEFGHRAAQESLPLRDAFAVLFFVSVGMLFDPASILRHPLAVAGVVAIVVAGKWTAAYVLARLLRQPQDSALTIAFGLAQTGEFSFILAELGIGLKLLPEAARDLVVSGAIFSILLNPAGFAVLDWTRTRRLGLTEEK